MKILICGGTKTNNIKIALERRFTSGMSFCTEEQIENIDNLITRGETFDRAIVFEQSISANGMRNEAANMRKNICSFIERVKENFTKYEIVFITETRDKARIIVEETLDVAHVSTVLVKSPPYATSFITQLVSVELRQFDKGMVFTQSDVRTMVESESEEEDIIWSDENERSRGELIGTECTDTSVIKQLENFTYLFTRNEIKVIDLREEIERTQFSDEVKSRAVGNKTKEIVRKG